MAQNMTSPDPSEIRQRLDDILPHVMRPGRYFAGEIGTVTKNWSDCSVKMVIGFPDVYEIAIGNLGHRLIQQIVNSVDGWLCERAYSPWPDMEEQLRTTSTPLYTLESLVPVADSDLFGISITHELAFTNVLQLIDLAGLPLSASERGFPIVIAGGPAVFNPEPLAEFIDAFILGDGEGIIIDLLKVIEDYREEIDRFHGDRAKEQELKKEILAIWGGAGDHEGLQGVYVPSHFTVNKNAEGVIKAVTNNAGGHDRVVKALVTDLESQPWLENLPIPHMQKLSGRVVVEPVRGCTHGCRFCQAGMIYRPYRERSMPLLLEQAEGLLESTGLREQSFLALSATDWPHLKDFVKTMQDRERDFHLKISLPSGRIADMDKELAELMLPSRKGGLTLAVESASPRLRAVINKEVSDSDIYSAVEMALSSGWDLIKLYFMIGLPTETDDDVLAIIELVKKIKSIHGELKKSPDVNVGRLKLRISVSSFVPKAHTPFQWAPMDTPESLDRKQKLLMPLRKIKGVEYKSHDIDASWIEGIMARGDREMSRVIQSAYDKGARFDAWSDQCDVERWNSVFVETGTDPLKYTGGRDVDEVLPWDHLSCGVSSEWLAADWKRALDETMLPDCNESKCHNCGMHEIYRECRPLRIPEK